MNDNPTLPDGLMIAMLLWESVQLGHGSPEEGMAWAEENGYIETMTDDDGEEWFKILDAGRRHVMADVIVPQWN